MYKLMIVDDEAVIREGLRKNIPWTSLKVELACEAADGIEAVRLFEEFKPNIVLMDINLPFINGLDVAQKILEADADVEIIVITGHNDFEYAQKTLKIGAFDLLLKPVNPSNICCTINKACDALLAKKNERLKSQNIQKLLEDSIPLLRERYLISLLTSGITAGEDQIREKFRSLGINIGSGFYNAAVIIPEMLDESTGNDELLTVASKEILEENLVKNGIKGFLYNDSLYRMVLIFGYSVKDTGEILDNIFTSIRDKLRFYLNTDAFIGIGRETCSLKGLSSSYKSACEALNYVNIYGRNNIVNIKNVNTIERTKFIYSGKEIDAIVTSFKTGSYEEFSEKLSCLIHVVITAALGNLEPIKRMCVEIMAAIFRVCDEMEISFEHMFEAEGPYAKILSFGNLLDLKSWVLNVCRDMINASAEKRHRRVNKLVELAKEYIHNNYNNEELSLKTVCEQVGLSNTYFCQLFFQETQQHFSEYINAVRVEAAKRYLEGSVMKIYEIAYAVGYNNPKYFNMIFKKVTSKTPLEYRNSYISGK